MKNFPGLYLQTLTLQNYRTFGHKKTVINFDDYFGLTSIRGLNKDQQTADSRNGCGKSSILSALCFAITGKPLKKAKSQGALVNHINKKGMRVTLDFWFKGQFCRIDRGVSPSFCKFYRRPVGETKDIEEYDESIRAGKGATEDLIQGLLGLDLAMFRLVVVSAAKQDAFFSMDAKDQKPLIESLFNQSGYVAAKKMLDVSALRHEALASNIAHLETPGYKRVDVAPSFASELQQAVGTRDVSRIQQAAPRLAVDSMAVSSRTDGNTVELETELLKMNQNAMEQHLETQLLTGTMLKLRLAITGRG